MINQQDMNVQTLETDSKDYHSQDIQARVKLCGNRLINSLKIAAEKNDMYNHHTNGQTDNWLKPISVVSVPKMQNDSFTIVVGIPNSDNLSSDAILCRRGHPIFILTIDFSQKGREISAAYPTARARDEWSIEEIDECERELSIIVLEFNLYN